MQYTSMVDNMFKEFFYEASSEGADERVPDKIEPFVHQLEAKGYQVRYASPGYSNTRFDNDRDKDGVINNKLVTTGRIIFSRNYDFDTTPKGWTWKVMHNGAKALYAKPFTYNEKNGSESDAFRKWQEDYLDGMKKWIADLPQAGVDKPDSEPDKHFS